MTIRTRLKWLEDWARRSAPKQNERQHHEAIQRTLDKVPLELLGRLRDALHMHAVENGKSGDPHAQVQIKDLDLSEELGQQLRACFEGKSKPVGEPERGSQGIDVQDSLAVKQVLP